MTCRLLLLILVSLTLSAAPAFADGPTPPPPKARCVVCGMFVAPYPNWVATIEFKDGGTAYFDGPRDMFTYLFDLEKYRPGTAKDAISGYYVTEYYSAQPMPVKDVFFITGSDVMGPMGAELVPVTNKAAALTFQKDHGGKKIMRFDGNALVALPADR